MFFPKRKLIAFLFLFCTIFLVFFFSSQPSVYTIRSAFSDVSKWPLYIMTVISHEIRAVVFFHRSYWDNLKLLEENGALKAELLKQRDASSENERLRDLLALKSKATYRTAAALVIGKDFGTFRPYLILNQGSSRDIRKYDPVFTPAGLVGKIIELGRYSSKVILINDPDLSVPAMDLRTREQGLVSGTLDGRCKLRFLDADSDIAEGDLVVTSGLNMTYPEGIVIGKVRIVGIEPSGLGKFAILEPAVKVFSVEEVLVARPSS